MGCYLRTRLDHQLINNIIRFPKPGLLHISRKDHKHMVANMFLSCLGMA